MTAIVVRELRPGEMPVLAALYGASFDEPYPEPVAASLLRTPGAWCHLAFDGADGMPVGFAMYSDHPDEIGTAVHRRIAGCTTAGSCDGIGMPPSLRCGTRALRPFILRLARIIPVRQRCTGNLVFA